MQNLLKLKEEFSKEGILISFNGPFNHSIIEEIGNATKSYLEGAHLDRGIITDVFAVYVEQTQNITNYIKKTGINEGIHSTAIVMINNTNDLYTIRSGNSILKEDVPALREYLNRLNQADKTDLKIMYKQQLRREINPGSLGAGLGLIDISRRASQQLDFYFESLDDQYDFFSLNVSIKGVNIC